jgi:hypothetical protein
VGFQAGVLACNLNCTLDTTGCHDRCGDGIIQGTETCDGTDLPDAPTCVDMGYWGGTPRCSSSCALDFRSCFTPGWTREHLPGWASPIDLWGWDDERVFATTGDGIFWRRAGFWSAVNAPPISGLTAIHGSGPDDVYFAGAAGRVIRFDGSDFLALDSGTTSNLSGVWASGPADVWVVADEALPNSGPRTYARN